MPRYDPFRGKSSRRRPIRVDVSETANGHREAAERLDVPDGDGELSRLEALGVTDPASVDFARRMDAAVIERATEALGHEVTPALKAKINEALTDPTEIPDSEVRPRVLRGPAGVMPEPVFLGARSLPGGGMLPPAVEGDTTERVAEGTGEPMTEVDQLDGLEVDVHVETPDTPHEGNGDDGEKGGGDAGATGDGAPSHDEGHPSPEPAPATTGDTAGSGAASDPAVLSPAAAALVDQVPAKATGYQGVVDWLKEAGLSAAQRYDRAEAAEWVEKQREAGQRKAVLAAVKPILYDD